MTPMIGMILKIVRSPGTASKPSVAMAEIIGTGILTPGEFGVGDA
jgi:hypothetical protein